MVLAERLLVAFHHHEYDLLVLVWTLKEILKVTLFLYLILRLLNMVHIVPFILSRSLLHRSLIIRHLLLVVHFRLLGLALVQDLVIVVLLAGFPLG